MAVVIRLRRAGSKKRPFYHMVVADSRMRRDGRFIEKVGYYNPLPRQEEISFDEERIEAWVSKGAQMSTTVERLVKRKQRGVTGPSTKERKRAAKKGAQAAKAVEEAAQAASAAAAAEEKQAAAEPTPEPAAEPEAAAEETASEPEPAASEGDDAGGESAAEDEAEPAKEES
jgi:small subunit ribosomal protein S16